MDLGLTEKAFPNLKDSQNVGGLTTRIFADFNVVAKDGFLHFVERDGDSWSWRVIISTFADGRCQLR